MYLINNMTEQSIKRATEIGTAFDTTKLKAHKHATSWKAGCLAVLIGLGIFAYLGFRGFMIISQWYDSNQVRFQSPVQFFNPVVIEKRKQIIKEIVKVENKPQTMAPAPKFATFRKFLTDKGASNRDWVLSYLKDKFSGDDLIAMDNIFKKESGYRTDAVNEIGAGGICQAYPMTKMGCDLDDLKCQVDWCISYVENRYKTPTQAYEFHQINNWF